jgi:hypothetical protein
MNSYRVIISCRNLHRRSQTSILCRQQPLTPFRNLQIFGVPVPSVLDAQRRQFSADQFERHSLRGEFGEYASHYDRSVSLTCRERRRVCDELYSSICYSHSMLMMRLVILQKDSRSSWLLERGSVIAGMVSGATNNHEA